MTMLGGKFIDVNQAWLDLFGYNREEMLRLNVQKVYADPIDRKRFLQEMAKRDSVKDFAVKIRRKDGTERECLLTSASWRSQNGNTFGYQGILRDITERNKMEEALRQSEERFRAYIEQASDLVFTLDMLGKLTFVNKMVCEVTGYVSGELLGKSPLELVVPEYRAVIESVLSRILIGEDVKQVEVQIFSRDKRRIWLEIRGRTLFEGSRIIGTAHIARDVTERKTMEEKIKRYSEHLEELVEERTKDLSASEGRFRRIYNASLDGIYVTSIDGSVLDMNPAGVSIFGFSSLDELKGVNIKSLYVDLADRKRFIELASKGPVRDFEVQFKRRDGVIIDCIINSYPTRDESGRVMQFQGSIRDVTESRRMEKLREEFISDVTDELLTPLVSIKGYLALAEESGSLPDEVKSALDAVKRNADRLLKLTNNLLDIRRMDSGRFELNLRPLDMREVIEKCVEETQPFVKASEQFFRVVVPEGTLPILGDKERLAQVVMNLLSNANKFTQRHGEVVLRVDNHPTTVRVQVSDTGVGIDRKDLARVFEPFAAITKPEHTKGAGLGLSVSKKLVEAHGGRIWVESLGEGKGATFAFTLPKQEKGG